MVKDIAETEKFYSSFLGTPEHLGDDFVAYKIGDTKIFFGLPYGTFESVNKDNSSLNHLAFGTRTLDELKELEQTLNQNNIQHSGIKIDKYGGKEFIWFDDPNGYRLEFYLRT